MYNRNKIASVCSYLGWFFWIVAFIIRDRDDALSRHHLNQGFVLAVAQTVVGILTRSHGLVGATAGILGLGVVALTIQGVVSALRESCRSLPVIGEIRIL